MNSRFSVTGLPSDVIRCNENVVDHLVAAVERSPCKRFGNGDVIVIAESALATAEGGLVAVASVIPSDTARHYADSCRMDPRLVEIVLRESDQVVGGVVGFLLCMKGGTLLPNAGVDASNAPEGHVVLLPKNPDKSAAAVRDTIFRRHGVRVAVIVADSRVHAMRSGCSGVAIGCSGMKSVLDERGRTDLYGRELHVTERALADMIASAAEIVMGEADECTPFALIRGLGVPMTEETGMKKISPDECLFMRMAARKNEHDEPGSPDARREDRPE